MPGLQVAQLTFPESQVLRLDLFSELAPDPKNRKKRIR